MPSVHGAIRTPVGMLAILAGFGLVALAALTLALAIGSVPVSFGAIVRGVIGAGDTQATIVHDLRLPRALAAFATGGLLALAGTLMQVLLRNPLADPYVLGISGGAATGALAAMLLGLGSAMIDAGA